MDYPADWEVVPVKKIADIKTGCRNTQDNKPNGRYKFFVRSPIVEHIDVADYDCEAVLTAGDGVGTGKVFHYVNGKFSAHQRVYIINNFRNVCGHFFYYYFSQNFMKEVEKYTAKSSVDSVRRAMIADMIIPLPPLAEQKTIADTLETFDAHIKNLSELIEKKKAIRDGALNDLMTGRTRLKGFSGDWKVKKLGEIVDIIRGASPRPIEAFLTFIPDGVNWIKISDADKNEKYITKTEEKITHEGALRSVFVNEGDLILSNSMSFGRPYILKISGCIHDGWLKLYNYENYINKEFLCYSLSSKNTYKQYLTFAAGSGVQNLNKNVVKNVLIPLPPLAEQKAIAETLTAFDDEIKALEAERDKIIKIRDGAMNDLLTGKIRLKF